MYNTQSKVIKKNIPQILLHLQYLYQCNRGLGDFRGIEDFQTDAQTGINLKKEDSKGLGVSRDRKCRQLVDKTHLGNLALEGKKIIGRERLPTRAS